MSTSSVAALSAPELHQLQQIFLADVLPRVIEHGRIYFRHVRCGHRREELLAETTALCWQWFLRLVRRGKDVLSFVSALVSYAARAVGCGRRVCGHERSNEVLSRVAQRRHGFSVERLPDLSTLGGNMLEEALEDNTVSPVPEQVAFRLDFPAWRLGHPERDRRLIDRLLAGEGTVAAAQALGLSPARISQKRRAFRDGWLAFCGEGRR
jgi:hypothetical protein